MTKLIGAFRDCANPRKKVVIANLPDIMATVFGRTPLSKSPLPDSLPHTGTSFFLLSYFRFAGGNAAGT